jgi:glycosyltransferase involved in cell wall biosynthesis/arylsulfatase A-like enzyme
VTSPNVSPLISVIATVRNERAGIRDFVESLLGQTLLPDEVIIVDGASTDGTLEILREYEAAGRIKVISRPCNISQGRNLGVAAARNELIAATDAGCMADREWLAHIVRAFSSAERPDVVAANYAFDTHSDFELASVLATDAPDREATDQAKYHPSSRSIGFRRTAWQAAKGYPEWLYAAEDTLFNIRLRQLGFKFVFCREAMVRWRPRSDWKGVFRQHFNYGRGNGRIGLGLAGYLINLQYHALFAVLVGAAFSWPATLVAAAFVLVQHARRNLLSQAQRAEQAVGRRKLFWLTLALMEVVRIASLSGFVAGRLDRWRDARYVQAQLAWMGVDSVEPPPPLPAWTSAAMLVSLPLLLWAILARWAWETLGPALILTVVLVAASLKNFSRTGPQLKDEIRRHYFWYSLFSFSRLTAWTVVLCVLMGGAGLLVLQGWEAISGAAPREAWAWLAALAGIALISGFQFCRHLLWIPGSIAASSSYRLSRFYPLWRTLSPMRLQLLSAAGASIVVASGIIVVMQGMNRGHVRDAAHAAALLVLYALFWFAAGHDREPRARKATRKAQVSYPNVLMIGSDTLRADRLGVEGYPRGLTPTLDRLAAEGFYLSQCYIPCGRTAPSLASLLTGTWPHTHGIRDNFALPTDAAAHLASLPEMLANHGYETIAISDWAGADLGKYSFGFHRRLLPHDQWNIKYLVRQGPKDIRLFLSLFTHSAFGRRFLPELYYLAGIPMTDEIGRDTRREISRCARAGRPFFINAFLSTTHAPFASEYPYYQTYSSPGYAGPSKFVMGLMNDPFEIIKQQRHTAVEFDLEQIHALYDGCVKRFDDEVARILSHVDLCGLSDSTMVVVYSDHGIEFFERDSWGQGNSVVVDGSSRIPLIIRHPRQERPVRLDAVTRSVDIAPTVLDLLGISIPSTMEGSSLGPELRGAAARAERIACEETGIWFTRIPGMPEGHVHYPDLPVLLEVPDKERGTLSIKPQYQELVIRAKDRAVRTSRWKLVYMPMQSGAPKLLLFDLSVDRSCMNDVAPLHPRVVAELTEHLFAWMPASERQHAEQRASAARGKRLRIAAVIPAYNAARYIGRAIASAQAQTYPIASLVVVDDGSTDDTSQVAASLGAGIRLVQQPNAGPSAARNRGVEEASAEVIAFLDADDEWLPQTLERLVDVFTRYPEVALVTADMAAVDEAGRVIEPSWFSRHGLAERVRAWGAMPVPRALAELMRTNFVSTSVVAVRTAAFRALGGFRLDLRYGEDLELWARIAARHSVVCLPEVLGLRRSHPGNSTKATEALLRDLVRMNEIVREWGSDMLERQGSNAAEMVARARTDLGYWYFTVGRRAEARAALLAAARERTSRRALRYLALSCLPTSAIAGLRKIRAGVHG